jgi:D-alanine-D-alanine ligase-like ATP-grasp enzyme
MPFTGSGSLASAVGMNKILTKKQRQDYYALATKVGEKLAASGWKGLFGIDVVVNEKTGKIYLIEVNARQPASSTCESLLQKENRTRNKTDITTFEAHVAALYEIKNKNEGGCPPDSLTALLARAH